jgi:ABC-type multidrug transport system permease subunit
MRPRHPLIELTRAKVLELLREPEALFWTFGFPVLLALALGIAFRSSGAERISVAVQRGEEATRLVRVLAGAGDIDVRLVDAGQAGRELRSGRVALVVVPGARWTYWFDPTRPESRLARLRVDELLQQAAGRSDPRPADLLEVTEPGSRYIDFLIPGLVGMNLMGTGIWGVGFYIVNARSKRWLKRLVATPMIRWHYLLAQVAGRMVFLPPEVGVLLLFAMWFFGVPLRGSWFDLAVVCVVGATAFAGLGLLVASRTRTIEGVSGLMNLVMLPMWILSGTFFSTARFPDWMQPLVHALPLTAVNDALRAVMIEGSGLRAVLGELGVAGLWGALSFAIAIRVFRWT